MFLYESNHILQYGNILQYTQRQYAIWHRAILLHPYHLVSYTQLVKWLFAVKRKANTAFITLLLFNSNSQHASLLRSRPSVISIQVPYKETEKL